MISRPLLLSLALLGAAQAQTSVSPAAPAQVAPAPRAAASSYVLLGNSYYSQGKYDQAYVAFRTAAELEPQNGAAWLGLGRAQTRLRLYAPATESLRHLTELESQNVSAFVALAQAYIQQYLSSSDRAALTGNLGAALETLQKAEAILPSLPEQERPVAASKLLNEKATIYRVQGKSAEAIEALRQATVLNPDNSLLFYNLGDLYASVGQFPLAISALQQAVITDPSDAYNRAYYARLLAQSGNLSAARSEAAQAVRLAPNNAYAAGQLGIISYLAADRTLARTQLTQAVKLEPLRYPEFYYYLGRLDLDSSDLKSARENLTRAVMLNSQAPEYAYYLGLAYERSQGFLPADPGKARENYQQALKLAPNYQQAREGLERVKSP